MIAELGHFAVILALLLAVVQGVVPLVGSLRGYVNWTAVARPAATGQFVFLAIAFAALAHAFLTDQFSVAYVAQNSNSALPLAYKFAAIWGAHEGSLLLWVLILAGWTVAVAAFSRNLPEIMVARVISVMGLISIGFLSFILFTSNPFDRLMRAPAEGRDLNPLLQDPGLVIHPPLLYMGYVGLSVAFAFALAALAGGRLDSTWARWSRPWTTVAWMFLTLGISLGSWWAYNELGWGGWWFWDPVENASLMPWLVATGLMHSLAVTEKRGTFRSWTVLLAILAFSLSLLGTFLVRSGVLTSVHAFATDPTRGLYILAFLIVVVGGSLALYAWRSPTIASGTRFGFLSRESLLLGNNLLLLAITAAVLLGTLYPLFYDAMGMGKLSVGFPWFNAMFLLFAPPLGVLMGIGPITRWQHDDAQSLWRRLRLACGIAVLAFLAFALYHHSVDGLKVALGMGLAVWIAATTVVSLRSRVRAGTGLAGKWRILRRQSRSYYGMLVAHLGIAVFAVGVAAVSIWGEERDVRLGPGDEVQVGGYTFLFREVAKVDGPNYRSDMATVTVLNDGTPIATLNPEKRRYNASGQVMTESGVDVGFTRDLYVALGEPLGDGSWSVRIYDKPFVRWIWGGSILMALGGLLAVSDRRYRVARYKAKAEQALHGKPA
ncbi:heme lyase CcmF/NrfE family subunit [Ectothiorhodospiraceae bacterium WFHF3C12]|nr:heme lyase CcmF/NrfE family subunit [Ectothiorhodospiraceae bacterium WFHF3C12]